MKEKICKLSLFSGILACVSAMPADAAVVTKNSNRSYAGAYQQVNAMRYQAEYANAQTATTASATANLPVEVADEQLANDILNNNANGTSVSDLESCAMIYPNGVFKWQKPESGVRHNQTPQCVSVIELRDATTNTVLATTTLAAGDTMKCNIDSFPEYGMNAVALSKTELPADAAPTMQDVEAVMNEEQKQNAGVKIAAGAIIAGLAGNLLAQKEPGAKTLDTIPLGAGKQQLIGTAAGVAAGAGIMAASTYSGKVAGDTIKSTAVNAASGMLVGNMMAGASGDDSVLATAKCKVKYDGKEESSVQEYDCIVGTCSTKETTNSGDKKIDKIIENGEMDGHYYFIAKHNGCKEMFKCDLGQDGVYKNCTRESISNFIDIKVELDADAVTGADKTQLCSSLKDSDRRNITKTYMLDSATSKELKPADGDAGEYLVVASATKVTNRRPAYAVFKEHLPVNLLGFEVADWSKKSENKNKEKDTPLKNHTIYNYFYRNNDGTPGALIGGKDVCEFEPSSRNADDGALIDLSNQARAKGTMIGAATGGAMGGFAGYQGATSELTDRWTAAVREYEDSLSNFMCISGTRFLSKYNDYVQIPEPKKSDE